MNADASGTKVKVTILSWWELVFLAWWLTAFLLEKYLKNWSSKEKTFKTTNIF